MPQTTPPENKAKWGWGDLEFWKSEKWQQIQEYLEASKDYYPLKENIFKALVLTPLQNVKVVILGQDPYPGHGNATGLAFSVATSVKMLPGSLMNIFKEYVTDTGYRYPLSGSLEPWAEKGVLLLNTCLTVKPGEINSHRNLGWDILVKEMLRAIMDYNPKTVFILWGQAARSLVYLTVTPKYAVISSHPSPRSATIGFFGSRPFTRCNALLKDGKQTEIDWRLP